MRPTPATAQRDPSVEGRYAGAAGVRPDPRLRFPDGPRRGGARLRTGGRTRTIPDDSAAQSWGC